MKYVIAGGSGSLGQRLARRLEADGGGVVVLTRDPSRVRHGRPVAWDARTVGPWAAELEGAIVVNLAGQLVDRRPTSANIKMLRSSRVDATLALKRAVAENGWTAPLWLQMSSLAVYGDAGDLILDESASPVRPLPQMTGVAEAWERAADGVAADRVVVLRTGIVLDVGTPALDRLVTLTRLGLGGRIASGRQWISWIHIDDFLGAVCHIIDTPGISDVVHVTSPAPAPNRDLMAALRRALRRPPALPTPTQAARAGAWLMGTDPALALTGRRCVPAKLEGAGYEFAWPMIDSAIADLRRR